MAVHHNVAASVDAILRGRSLTPEIRYRDESGQVRVETPPPPAERRMAVTTSTGRLPFDKRGNNGRSQENRSQDGRSLDGRSLDVRSLDAPARSGETYSGGRGRV